MIFPQILKRLFFPRRHAEDRPDPRFHKAEGFHEPAPDTEAVLDRAAQRQDRDAASASKSPKATKGASARRAGSTKPAA